MRPLDPRPTVTVGHLNGSNAAFGLLWWGREDHYKVTAYRFERPSDGSDIIELRCRTCDEELLLRLDSLDRLRRFRRRCLATAAVGLGVIAVTVAAGLITDAIGRPLLLEDAPGQVTLIAFLASLPVVGVAVYRWWNEDGVRLHSATGSTDPVHCRMDGNGPRRAAA